MTEQRLRELIRQLYNELKEEELEELTTTAATPGYNTPMAFKATNGKKRKKKKVNEELNAKDMLSIKKLIRTEVASILRDIWIKRTTWA
jgi:hypothetical protein